MKTYKQFLSFVLCTALLLSVFQSVALAIGADDYTTYFSEICAFPMRGPYEERQQADPLPDGRQIVWGRRLPAAVKPDGEDVDCLYLFDAEKQTVLHRFSDEHILETNAHQLPYSVQKDAVYAVTNTNTLLRISLNGEKTDVLFQAKDDCTIKDFIIADRLIFLFSGNTIYRIFLPTGTTDEICTSLDEEDFCMFLNPISNYEISWCDYAPDFWNEAGKEGFFRNRTVTAQQSDAWAGFIITHSNMPMYIARYLNVQTGEARQAESYPTREEDDVGYGWWKQEEQPMRLPIGDCFRGDADRDGTVSAADARLALRYSVGLEWMHEKVIRLCDLDGDGGVSAADARLILRTSVGLEPLNPGIDRFTPQSEPRPIELPSENVDFASVASLVSKDDLTETMEWLVDSVGERSWWNNTQNAAAMQIVRLLESYGYTAANCSQQEFFRNGIKGVNILVRIPAKTEFPSILLVVSHYDTARGTGGAVDNASGTAALLQIAKVFQGIQHPENKEIRFLFTAGEEQGYYGAEAYLQSLNTEEKERLSFVFNIDMAGKPNRAYDPNCKYCISVSTEPISANGYDAPEAAENVGSAALDLAKEALGHLGEDAYYSPVRAGVHDIIPFRKAGIPSLTVSWRVIDPSRSNGADHDLVAPNIIHTAKDSVRNFDMDSLYQTTKLIVCGLVQLETVLT